MPNQMLRMWLMLATAGAVGAYVAMAEAAPLVKETSAEASKGDVSVAAPAAPSVHPSATSDAAKQEQAKKEWMAKLNGTRWSVAVTPMSAEPGKSPKPKQDTLAFSGPQITSELLVKEGYSGSNFTLRLEDDGSAIWETMQGKEGGHLAFWRGNVQGDVMRGVVSKRSPDGTSVDYSFSGAQLPSQTLPPASAAVEMPPTAQPPAAAQPAASAQMTTTPAAASQATSPTPVPAAEQPSTTTKSKKKRW